MIAIITGDIINSRDLKSPSTWLNTLKEALNHYGQETRQWKIYRGDSFQIEVSPLMALEAAIYIKANIKTIKNADVRMAIGLGEKSFTAEDISESNGEAFELSGIKFETLKKEKQNLALQTADEKFNEQVNLLIKLALIAMDNWKTASAMYVKTALQFKNQGQTELGEILGINQSSVSERHKRAYFNEIQELLTYYQNLVNQQF